MNLYLILLRAFLNKDIWERYGTQVDATEVRESHPELYRIYLALPTLHTSRSSNLATDRPSAGFTVADLELAFKTCYPNSKDDVYRPIFGQLQECTYDPDTVEHYLETQRKRLVAKRIALAALPVWEGKEDFATLSDTLKEVATDTLTAEMADSPFVEDNLDELITHTHSEQGLRWRLDSLNRALGSIRTGDFGFVFARPETGKTTFLADQVSFMAGQTDRPVIWFNNEEQSRKVLLRCYQAALGITNTDLYRNRPEDQSEYERLTGNRIKVIREPTITKRSVEDLCQRFQPGLIIFDQIDQIKGFSDDRNDLELKAIYTWAREIAKQYAPVIAVCQAGSTGDGKRWLTMNDVDNSKTGKQGAADWILGIGKIYDDAMDNVRFLHLSKNKLLGDDDADEAMRHGKWEVKIRPEIARYEDF